MLFLLLELGILLSGLILITIGAILLTKSKSKIVGITIIAAGLVLTILPVLLFLSQIITTSVRS